MQRKVRMLGDEQMFRQPRPRHSAAAGREMLASSLSDSDSDEHVTPFPPALRITSSREVELGEGYQSDESSGGSLSDEIDYPDGFAWEYLPRTLERTLSVDESAQLARTESARQREQAECLRREARARERQRREDDRELDAVRAEMVRLRSEIPDDVAAAAAVASSGCLLLELPVLLEHVMRVVDENDALWAALTCTQFRDTLYAQARHGVRAVGPHAGSRMLTGVVGVASSVARLAWVRQLGDSAPRWVQAWDHNTSQRLAAVGALEALQWARTKGCEWDCSTCNSAAQGGHLEVLKWAKANGCPFGLSGDTCYRVALGGYLEVLKWAWANGCRQTSTTSFDPYYNVCSAAALQGHLETLQWARAKGCRWDASTCYNAALGGHLEVLQWARANGCEWNATTCNSAAGAGHLRVLQWARSNGCEWDVRTCHRAARGGHLDILQWARANGCGWDATTCKNAVQGRHLEVVQWLLRNSCEWDAKTRLLAKRIWPEHFCGNELMFLTR